MAISDEMADAFDKLLLRRKMYDNLISGGRPPEDFLVRETLKKLDEAEAAFATMLGDEK